MSYVTRTKKCRKKSLSFSPPREPHTPFSSSGTLTSYQPYLRINSLTPMWFYLEATIENPCSRLSNITLHLPHLQDLLKQFLNLLPRVTDLFQSWMGLASGMFTSFPFDAEEKLRLFVSQNVRSTPDLRNREWMGVCVCVCVCVCVQVIHVHSKACELLDLKRMNKGKSYLERLNSGTLQHLSGNKITTRKW